MSPFPSCVSFIHEHNQESQGIYAGRKDRPCSRHITGCWSCSRKNIYSRNSSWIMRTTLCQYTQSWLCSSFCRWYSYLSPHLNRKHYFCSCILWRLQSFSWRFQAWMQRSTFGGMEARRRTWLSPHGRTDNNRGFCIHSIRPETWTCMKCSWTY